MALSSTNVRSAVTGAVYNGATSLTAPTTTTSSTASWTDLGYIGEDGVTLSKGLTSTNLKGWQNAATVRTVITDGTLTLAFTMIETKQATLEAYHGSAATLASGEGTLLVTPTNTGGVKSWLFDVVDGSEIQRLYVPLGEVTETGDVVFANGSAIGYPVTVTAYYASAISATAKLFATALHT